MLHCSVSSVDDPDEGGSERVGRDSFFFCKKRLLYCATWLLLAEVKRKEQEFSGAMSLWKQQQRQSWRLKLFERYALFAKMDKYF